MTLAGATAQYLPMLRRFARALTGSQAGGDAYVIAMLETLAETGQPDYWEDPRVALFAALLRVWESVPLNLQESAPNPEGIARAADRSLERLTPRSRVAFLLHALEGFSIDEIALIMDVEREAAAAWQDAAGHEIAAMISTSVLIIEDEPLIAMDLEALVTDLGHTVTEVARTHSEAIAAIRANPPGLVLADIHLADGSSGLDAVNEIVREYDGSFSAEHGIGKLKPYMMPDWRGGAELALMVAAGIAVAGAAISLLRTGSHSPDGESAHQGG